MTSRRGLGYRIGQACCWAIGVECLGGELYYAVRAGAFIAIVLCVLLGAGCWYAVHHHRRQR